jgi:hypothetical protein
MAHSTLRLLERLFSCGFTLMVMALVAVDLQASQSFAVPLGIKPTATTTPHLTDRHLDRFIVVPEYKLLFCYIEKVGCVDA